MRLFNYVIPVCVISLAGCGGIIEELINSGYISDGALEDIELPSEAELAGLPASVTSAINAFASVNEGNALTPTMPQGSATFNGAFAVEAEDDGEIGAYISGDAALNVNFDTFSLTGQFDNMSVFEASDNSSIPVTSGLFSLTGTVSGSTFSSTLSGSLNLEGEIHSFSGGGDGVFAGNGATSMLSEIEGTTVDPNSHSEPFFGVFSASQ